MYERKTQPLLSRSAFLRRLLNHIVAVVVLMVVSLAAGMLGYIGFEHLSPVDAFLNAAMLLGGMGPVNPPQTVSGKLFAGAYALYAGLVFILCSVLVLTPVAHRVLHRFHWDSQI